MLREQKISKMGCPCEGMSNKGARSTTSLGSATKNRVNLLEVILSKDNLNVAYRLVKRKKGAAGIDGMEFGEMLELLKENKENS